MSLTFRSLPILAAFFFIFAILGHGLSPARADASDDIFANFATDKFSDTEKAVVGLAASATPNSLTILEALADGRLYFDASTKIVYFKSTDGALYVATSNAKAADVNAAALKKVRLNNTVRSALQSAQGSMGLLAADPARRRSAAEAVFKAHDIAALPAVDLALTRETDSRVKLAFTQARAAILAYDTTATDLQRLTAIDVLRERADQDTLGHLSAIAASSDGRIKTAAQAGMTAIQSRLSLLSGVQNIWYGLSLGSVLLLAAIGLAITFGVMGVINMAHGEMVMLGAYTTFVVQDWIRVHNPALFDYSLLIALPLAFLVTAIVGMMIERIVIRYLYGRPLETLLATFGVSLVLQQAVRSIFGANNREVGAPSFMAGSFDLGGLAITSGRMWIVFFTILVFGLLQLMLKTTSFGLRMRAVTQNRRMASAMGIDTNRIYAMAFGLGSGIAGIAGVALSQIDNVSPNLGQSYIIDSFMVVVFGGVGNLWGTLVAAFTLGIANKFLEPMVGAVLGKILLLVFIIVFIQKRPRGLFAQKGRAVEV